ncbi:glycosyl hydrolase catalytic core-domain-containing protein [Mariannaea sp. PMI_226]|nr:glycosyl hydrolase catalytic core-domain-containing protein [Mariannaea sp. PMI_226]
MASLTQNYILLLFSRSPSIPNPFPICHLNHTSDTELLVSENSTISWYYTWSMYSSDQIKDSVPFVPLIHSLDDASNPELTSQLSHLPSSSTRLLTFNEPDGETDTGGSSISPEDAAESYMSHIAPLRNNTNSQSRKWAISHPAVTGSPRGLEWLRKFNESCYKIDDGGCPTDFVALHWYGNYDGLVSWLDTLREFYNKSNPNLEYWITEMALPKANDDDTLAMMNQSLKYLDSQDYVQAYAWFGAFRAQEANEWTGDSVSLFNKHGDLTELGALYLGGKARGFEKGMSAGHQLLPSNALILGLVSMTVAIVMCL